MRIADEMSTLMPTLRVDRDLVVTGALCHDVGKPWEFIPENRRRWGVLPRAAGLPSVRHPAFGVHVCFTVGLPEEVAHCAAARPARASCWCARSRTRSCTTPTTRLERYTRAPAACWCPRASPSSRSAIEADRRLAWRDQFTGCT